jgi:phosphohistidine phosphatase
MKQLLLLRHAKSSWQDDSLSDHQRPLNDRGERDAPRIGRLICEQGLIPDLIISSSATRAQQTARAVATECDGEELLQVTDELYHAAPQTYLSILVGLADNSERVLMVGHNPGIESLVEWLSGEPTTMTTAALAHLQLSIESWSQFESPQDASLHGFWTPHDLD